MKKFILCLIYFVFSFNAQGNTNEADPYQQNVEEVFNIGQMLSHDKKFTLFFKSRKKAVLARGEEFNYITDYPQDLYILYNETGKISPLITYDWFPKEVKNLSLIYDLPVFPEDYAYYLLKDCGYKDVNSTYKCSYYKPLISVNLIN